ncbi:MAG: methyltransferase, partial [Desulfovermiculus sp.]
MEERITIQGRDYRFQRPADLETLWEQLDEKDFWADERLPYWVEIWPAGIFLAQWIVRQKGRLSMDWCLDLGCGLGVSTCVAAEFTGRALGLDYEFAALSYARRNAGLNGCAAANWALMDWRRPGLK